MPDRTELPFSELPGWARAAIETLLGPRKRPRCFLEVSTDPHMGSPWHDACKVYYVARDARGRIEYKATPYYESILNATPQERALFGGGRVQIPPDCAMLRVETYPESATLYLHPDNAPKALPLPQADLTPIQAAVLDAHVGYTSAGRRDLWLRHYIPRQLVDAVVEEMAAMGLLTKNSAGAVSSTLKGRQARSTHKGQAIDWYQWGRCYDIITRRWSGFAREVLLEYQKRLKEAS